MPESADIQEAISSLNGDISGAVVNLAARVEQAAGSGDICVTKSLRDMVLGSSHEFESVGERSLKGFDGAFHLFRLTSD